MCADRNEIREALSKLTPKERAEVEALVVEKVLRDASERHRARDPKAYAVAEAHSAEVIKAFSDPLPPGAEEKLGAALAVVARAILAEDGKP